MTLAPEDAMLAIVLCPEASCDPDARRLCASCQTLLDAAFPDRCADPNCDACTGRGAAEAARAEQ